LNQSLELTAPFVSAFKDDAQRFTSAQILAPVFSRRDPMAAEQWIHGLNLPAEQKRQLLKLQPERRATLAHPPTRYRL